VSPLVPALTEAREAALSAALDLVTCERHLHDRASSASRITKLQEDFYLAARDLTNAIDNAPPTARPRNWALDAEGATA
jgi:hypothetical protein